MLPTCRRSLLKTSLISNYTLYGVVLLKLNDRAIDSHGRCSGELYNVILGLRVLDKHGVV